MKRGKYMNQIDKNDVPAEKQLKTDTPLFYENKDGKGIRILFVGNSITLHGYKPDIGWYGVNYGMAASAKENDYAHLVMREVKKKDDDAACAICQASQWELNYKDCDDVLYKYDEIRDFDADIMIMRIVENCPTQNFDSEKFFENYKKLIDYINPNGKARVILTTGFWKHPGDDEIIRVGKEREYDTIYLGELGEDESMKAIGLFEHGGVANHPGDKGMRAIADLILEKL